MVGSADTFVYSFSCAKAIGFLQGSALDTSMLAPKPVQCDHSRAFTPACLRRAVQQSVASERATAMGDVEAPPLPPLPAVTIVFCGVENVARSRLRAAAPADARTVHKLLRESILCTLKAFPGAYLCQDQELELRFMLAFGSPKVRSGGRHGVAWFWGGIGRACHPLRLQCGDMRGGGEEQCNVTSSLHDERWFFSTTQMFSAPQTALAWCLETQEYLMYLPWPPAVLALPCFQPEIDGQSETLLFRGPRLKMGVCEGRPRSIQPDHLARADYHGHAVNMAARFFGAAAHAGQVGARLQLLSRSHTAL